MGRGVRVALHLNALRRRGRRVTRGFSRYRCVCSSCEKLLLVVSAAFLRRPGGLRLRRPEEQGRSDRRHLATWVESDVRCPQRVLVLCQELGAHRRSVVALELEELQATATIMRLT
jgi:hypothetical protein